MKTRSFHTEALIRNTPEAVIAYIADARHRALYLPSLKSVSDVEDEPEGVSRSWKWTFGALGLEFEGTGRRTAYEPGRLYAFETSGGIESAWTYTAAPDAGGTRLSVDLEYEVPERALPFLPTESIAEGMRRAEAARALENLKAILDA